MNNDRKPQGIQHFSFPLSNGNRCIIIFERLPVTKEDVELILKWLDLFGDNLIKQKEIKKQEEEKI